jgi:hypothetical protein
LKVGDPQDLIRRQPIDYLNKFYSDPQNLQIPIRTALMMLAAKTEQQQ